MAPQFTAITGAFNDFMSTRGFKVLVSEADRHGSLEWTAAKSEQALNRFVSLFLTERIAGVRARAPWLAEIWAGADDSRRFTRTIVDSRLVPEPELSSTQAVEVLVKLLDRGVNRAEALTHSDLTDAYSLR